MMPELTGMDLHAEVSRVAPDQGSRMIFITGDVINDRAQKFLEQHNRPCLPKPFSLADFRAAIRKVLAA